MNYPDIQTLLSLDEEGAGGVVLEYLQALDANTKQAIHPGNHFSSRNISRQFPGDHDDISQVLMEGWGWLVRNGFVVENADSKGWFKLSRKAQGIRTAHELKESFRHKSQPAEAEPMILPTYNFPRIPLREDEKIWLNAIYSKRIKGEKVNTTELLIELDGQISEDFEYKRIDPRLASFGFDITLLGILQLDPTTDFVKHTHNVIVFIRDLIKKYPGISEVTSDHVAKETELTEYLVATVFNFMRQLGNFWGSGSGDGSIGYRQISIDSEPIKREYLRYKNMADLLDRLYQSGEPNRTVASIARSPVTPFPTEIRESIARFQRDYPDASKAAFIMMRFSKTKAHDEITTTIRETLAPFGIRGLRADDKEYHEDLYQNIRTYIYGCSFGIAVFERIETEDFNPNVSFELGYMFAIGKSVCLLKDKTLQTMPADLVGKLYRQFNLQDITATIPIELRKWLSDKNLV